MPVRHTLNPRRRFRRWKLEPLKQKLAENLICALRNPLAGGGYNSAGDGTAGWKSDIKGPWYMERRLRRGQWAGPWRRVRAED